MRRVSRVGHDGRPKAQTERGGPRLPVLFTRPPKSVYPRDTRVLVEGVGDIACESRRIDSVRTHRVHSSLPPERCSSESARESRTGARPVDLEKNSKPIRTRGRSMPDANARATISQERSSLGHHHSRPLSPRSRDGHVARPCWH